eukprot:m.196031 g.196031  ORF g.196031 m.196031 type:complete len:84 (+) comp15245_c0_seq6:1648-1899(+)
MCRAREGLCSPVWTRDGIFTAVALREMIFTTPKERETRVEPATFGRVCLGKEDQVPLVRSHDDPRFREGVRPRGLDLRVVARE